ncbi:MAG TPA: hypothetical protein VJQ59_16710 [Candidatus Sulfotelmatobacter sp.]|nr:hypothetical protein [Candidatus Sulfotelmatobacter sp.]
MSVTIRCVFLIVASTPLFGRASATGYCEQGGSTAAVTVASGVYSGFTTPAVQISYPSCTVTVSLLAGGSFTIYSDNSGTPIGTGTSVAFTATSTGLWTFFGDANNYVVTLSGGGISSPFAINVYLPGTAAGITTLNTLTASTQTFATGTAGTDFGISSSGSIHTFNLPTASASNRGLLSTSDWSTFNSKQAALSVTAPITLASNTIGITLPLTIGQGGTGQITQTLAFNALSPLTTKGDLLTFNGTNSIRHAVGTDGQCWVADSAQADGLNWKNCASVPVGVASGGTGATTLTGSLIGSGTSAVTAVAAGSQLQSLRRKPNQTTTTYEFALPPYVVSSDFDFPSQAPGGSLTGGVGASATLTPCPLGVNGTDTSHYIYLSGGTGTAEAVVLTGGSCTSGASTGTVTFTPANSHSGAWTITSATNGVQEGICYLPSGNNKVVIPAGTTTLNANVSFCGQTSAVIEVSNGVTLSGAGTLPSVTVSGAYVINNRSGALYPNKGANITSATTIAPVAGISHVTGTTTITTITAPAGFTTGCIVLIPDGLWVTTTGGNIALGTTAVVSKALTMCYDGSLWYPSYN